MKIQIKPIIDNYSQQIDSVLRKKLNRFTPADHFSEIYEYALFPTGKLIRPLINYLTALDLNIDPIKSINHHYFACFLEIHHTYTLIHDDLPSMDNDEYRRNRLTVHKKFGEWQAILSGDALLNLSYQMLSQINSKHPNILLNLVAHLLGPKGLVLGQVMDLSIKNHSNSTFNDILKIHELKTARLLQASIVGSALVSNNDYKLNFYKDLYRVGYHFGILFQLIDDLLDFHDKNKSAHEININPFFNFDKKIIINEISSNQFALKKLLEKNHLNHLYSFIDLYLKNFSSELSNKNELDIISLLQSF